MRREGERKYEDDQQRRVYSLLYADKNNGSETNQYQVRHSQHLPLLMPLPPHHPVMKLWSACVCVQYKWDRLMTKKLRTFLSSIGSGDHFSRHGLLSSWTDISWAISSTIWQSGYQPNHIIYLPLPPPRHDGRFSSQKLPLNVECYKRKIWKKHRYANSFCCCYQRLGKKCQG